MTPAGPRRLRRTLAGASPSAGGLCAAAPARLHQGYEGGGWLSRGVGFPARRLFLSGRLSAGAAAAAGGLPGGEAKDYPYIVPVDPL